MGSALLEIGRSVNINEFCFKAAKRSDKDCVKLQGGLFTDIQVWHLQAAKRSDKNCTILQEGRFAHTHGCVFTVRNVKIWAVLSSNELIC